MQVRVVQGKEPLHFVRLFRGQMVVQAGGKASGFKNTAEVDTYDEDGISSALRVVCSRAFAGPPNASLAALILLAAASLKLFAE